MTRREALAALWVAIAMAVAGLVWLFGPYGLLGAGLVLIALLLLVVDVKERRAEPADDAATEPSGRGRPLQHR